MAPEAIDVQVEKFARVLDLGHLLDRRTEGFSQGERMKVAIARALVHDPQNILLDEPTNGLDVMTTRALRDLVRELRDAGKCVVFSSHVKQEVNALCDEIVIVSHGRVAASGAPEAIREASGKATLEDAFVSLTGGGA
jgi:sodium transport system ATP-binding protein